MTGTYIPTTEEIREYVEVGGEPRPWLPPTPDEDAARVAAFDRWLAQHEHEVAAKCAALAEQRAGIAGDDEASSIVEDIRAAFPEPSGSGEAS